MPGETDKPTNTAKPPQEHTEPDHDGPVKKWSKRIYAGLGLIAVIGGVLTFGTTVDHWFSGLSQPSDSTCHISVSDEIERSPNLGISFHQNNQVAVMSYVNSGSLQTPLIDVCLSPAPFEIWFPTLTGSDSVVEICTSLTTWVFHGDPGVTGPNGPGCLVPVATDVVDYIHGSGSLPVTTPEVYPAHEDITGTRAEAAGPGQEKFFVSSLYTKPTLNTSLTTPMSKQTANLYLVIFATQNFANNLAYTNSSYGELPVLKYTNMQIEHFVIRFR